MALTDFCDVLGAVHEEGFNRIIFHLVSQRPSLFHYGTETFVKNPQLLCCPPEFVHPEVTKRGNPVVKQLGFLAIPGYDGDAGLEYNFSLKELKVDFEPTNQFNLPAELGNKLSAQSFAIKAVVCGGIACPERDILDKFIIYPEPYRPDFNKDQRGSTDNRNPAEPKVPTRGLPFQNVNCFKLELFVVLNFVREDYLGEPVLGLKLQNIEIVDITPDGLENSIECLVRTTLVLSVFPKIRIAMKSLVFNIKDFITIEPTAISASVPFNPAVENDTLTVRLSIPTP